jgi:transcription antitermination protein NusB
MNRHKQRDYTFRVVFSMEQNITEIPLEDLDLHLESAELQTEEDKSIIREKVTHIFGELKEIDGLIETAADRWSIDRIAKIELAILRVAIYDMKYDNIPVQIAVNEAVELSKKYGDEQSSKFVNGVLGQIVKKL